MTSKAITANKETINPMITNTDNTKGLDKETQVAIGMRLEWMYHTATSIHDMVAQLIGDGVSAEKSHIFWAIQELARGQARELEAMASHLQDAELGYYAEHFIEFDPTKIQC